MPPTIYILHGDDELAITRYLAEMEGRLGDPGTIALNTSRLDGNTYNLNELIRVTSAMPFLAKRRLVILESFVGRLKDKPDQEAFQAVLLNVPPSTALVLVERKPLVDERERRKNKEHWLEKWAKGAGDKALLKEFTAPKGAQLARWIQEEARAAGGEFTQKAAELLGQLVDDQPRQAAQEIHKLLAYVNYSRPVEPDDVHNLTTDSRQGNIFAMVDALSAKDGRLALQTLHRLLEEDAPAQIFPMIIRQFRLLILAREILDDVGPRANFPQLMGVPQFVADKSVRQASQFSLPVLEAVYRRLLEIDEAVKSSQVEGDIALDTLVASFTSQK
ncbi:MAG TPA: DNA polymerase III subunit delta [Anaerolineales bacterium]|nr:DNA polymerase III subunit delta [Anaerolineales bacterium]